MSNINTEGLDDYNPFANNSNYGTNSKPATLETSSNNRSNGEHLLQDNALKDLERRQRELDDRARALDSREQHQSHPSNSSDRLNNYPPLPSFCPLKPCFHQDFENDFAVGRPRSLIKQGYYTWLFYSFTMTINMIVAFYNFFSSEETISERGSVFGQALIYFFLFIPLAFLLWYRPLYRALRVDSSASFFLFFIFFGIQLVIVAIQTLGITYFGAFGWLISIAKLTGGKKALGITMIVTACLFTISLTLIIILFLRVHGFYRGTGASFDKARDEFGREVAGNVTLRKAAGDMTVAAAKNAATSATKTTTTTTTNNY